MTAAAAKDKDAKPSQQDKIEAKLKDTSKDKVKLKMLSPCLMVKDLNVTLAFYQNILGFEDAMVHDHDHDHDGCCGHDHGDDDHAHEDDHSHAHHGFAWLQRNEVNLMFEEAPLFNERFTQFKGQAPGGSLTLYFWTKHVDDFYARIKDQVTVVEPLNDADWGMREFTIQDPDGYLLVFGYDLEE